jgi:AcrR family transcriptional regulator
MSISRGEHSPIGGHVPHTSRGEAQRRALVDAAYHLIAEGGFERLRTRDVAARAGVNIATLHYYFATKEDLIRGVVQRVHHELSTMHTPALATDELTPLEELREELMDMQFQLSQTPETYEVLFELHWRAKRDPAIFAMLRDMDASWQVHIRRYLSEGVRQGVFRADLDVPAAATALVALIKGGIMQLLSDPESFPIARVQAEIERWITGQAVSHE